MDERSFDRFARLLGGAANRRAGLKAALGALVTGGLAADAAAKGKDGRRDARRKGNDTDRGRGRRNADTGAGGGAEDAKKKVCRAVGATCKKAKNCCSGYCLKSTAQKKRKGVCQCLAEGETCSAAAACCGGLACVDGRCLRQEVPTGQACGAEDICQDPAASCVYYDPTARSGREKRGRRDRQARNDATRICLLGGGEPCAKNEVCASLNCVDNVCTGPRFVPLGDACVPGQDRCADSRARCGAYAAGSGGPAGDYCLLGNGEVCDTDPQCRNNDCAAGFCGRKPVDTGGACDPQRDACRNPNATCVRYANGGDPQTYCLLGDGQICDAATQCVTQECTGGTCGGAVPVPTGGECTAGQDTCAAADASCTVYANLPDQTTRCLVRTGGACDANADCVTLSCERGICVDLQPGACDVCKDGCAFSDIAAAIESGLEDISILGGDPDDTSTWHAALNLPGGNRKLTLRTCTSAQATITPDGQGRAMTVAAGGDVTLINIRVFDGRVSDYSGGAFLVNPGGRLTLVDSEIENCVAEGCDAETETCNGGGGVMVLAGELEMIGGAMRGNFGEADGGALLLVDAQARLSGVTFENNRTDWDGGAVFMMSFGYFEQDAGLDIEECVFRQNRANDDGGAIALELPASIRDSIFTGNVAEWYGGAVHVDQCYGDGTSLSGCTFTGNRSKYGGAVYNDALQVSITNSAVSDNDASSQGGGVYNGGGVTLMNVQATGNSAGDVGGGVFNYNVLALLGTTLVSGNTAQDGAGIFNFLDEYDPEYSGEVKCWLGSGTPNVCGNSFNNCIGMEDQGTCVSLGVCKPDAC